MTDLSPKTTTVLRIGYVAATPPYNFPCSVNDNTYDYRHCRMPGIVGEFWQTAAVHFGLKLHFVYTDDYGDLPDVTTGIITYV